MSKEAAEELIPSEVIQVIGRTGKSAKELQPDDSVDRSRQGHLGAAGVLHAAGGLQTLQLFDA